MVRMGAQPRGRRQLLMTAGANMVAGDRPQLIQMASLILAMWVVARRAIHRRRAMTEQEIARFARIRRAAARMQAPLAALPGERILRKEHGVALGAAAVDVLSMRRH